MKRNALRTSLLVTESAARGVPDFNNNWFIAEGLSDKPPSDAAGSVTVCLPTSVRDAMPDFGL